MADTNQLVDILTKILENKTSSGMSDILEIVKLDFIQKFLDKKLNQESHDMDTKDLLLFWLFTQMNQNRPTMDTTTLLLLAQVLGRKDTNIDDILKVYMTLYQSADKNANQLISEMKEFINKQQEASKEQVEKLAEYIGNIEETLNQKIMQLQQQILQAQQSKSNNITQLIEQLNELNEAKKQLKRLLSGEEPVVTPQGGINWDKVLNTVTDIISTIAKGSNTTPPPYNPPQVPVSAATQATEQLSQATQVSEQVSNFVEEAQKVST